MGEQALIIHFRYGSNDLTELFELENKLEDIIKKQNLGEFDGDEIATDCSDGFLYMYGPDARKIFDAIRDTLTATPFMRKAIAKLQFGPSEEDGKEENFILPD
jgi:hypothetical protein